jgi:hypothetical protein
LTPFLNSNPHGASINAFALRSGKKGTAEDGQRNKILFGLTLSSEAAIKSWNPSGIPSFSGDCVVIMEEERFGRDRQSGSSALECGHLKLSLIDLLGNTILSWGCNSVAY